MESATPKPQMNWEACRLSVNASRLLSLKVDVDTHDGMCEGVPRLLDIFQKAGVRATFFLSFGPDNAGRAIFNIFREKGFLKKMIKTRAPTLYGIRTILSGTLLPPRPIATKFPDLVRRIEEEGHECEIHAWDHRLWQDNIASLSLDSIRSQITKARQAFEDILGHPAKAFGAPSWRITEKVLAVEAEMGFLYASDLREGSPCFLKFDQKALSPLQIPTTGPCLEELIAVGIKEKQAWLTHLLQAAEHSETPVIALHAEVEGGPFKDVLSLLLSELKARSYTIVPLEEMATVLLERKETLPVRRLRRTTLKGRSGWVSTSG